jgi:hypothetical protein
LRGLLFAVDILSYCCYFKKVELERFLDSVSLPAAQCVKFSAAGTKNRYQLSSADLQNLSEDEGLSRPALKP